MTRKDFIALAQALTCIKDPDERETVAILVAAVCRSSNPRFDTAKFMAACGL